MTVSCPAIFKKPKLLRILTLIALIFGAASLLSGGLTLFGPRDIQRIAGDFIPFVVWFNFLGGFVYIAAAFGLLCKAPWGVQLALAITLANVIIFSALSVHIFMGEAFEIRTVGAMIFRTSLWALITIVARQQIQPKISAGITSQNR